MQLQHFYVRAQMKRKDMRVHPDGLASQITLLYIRHAEYPPSPKVSLWRDLTDVG